MSISARYSARSAGALAYLKSRNYDVDIFVEDTACRNMWREYLARHYPKHKSPPSLNLLGGKEAVLAACDAMKNDKTRRRLFIVDGDFDLLLRDRPLRKKDLYTIPAYCIENMLISDDSIIDIATTSSVNISTDDAKSKFLPSQYIDKNAHALKILFTTYAVARQLDPSIKTTGTDAGVFLSNDGDIYIYCIRKALKHALSISRDLRNSFGHSYYATYREVRTRARRVHVSRFCSGKDYLLYVLYLNLRRAFQYRGSIDQLRVSLAKHRKTPIDRALQRRLYRLTQG